MKCETVTIPGQQMIGVTIREPRTVKFLKFSTAELRTIRRACEILEAGGDAVLAMHGGGRMASLADYGDEGLSRGLFTGDILDMLSRHGPNGIELHGD